MRCYYHGIYCFIISVVSHYHSSIDSNVFICYILNIVNFNRKEKIPYSKKYNFWIKASVINLILAFFYAVYRIGYL